MNLLNKEWRASNLENQKTSLQRRTKDLFYTQTLIIHTDDRNQQLWSDLQLRNQRKIRLKKYKLRNQILKTIKRRLLMTGVWSQKFMEESYLLWPSWIRAQGKRLRWTSYKTIIRWRLHFDITSPTQQLTQIQLLLLSRRQRKQFETLRNWLKKEWSRAQVHTSMSKTEFRKENQSSPLKRVLERSLLSLIWDMQLM